MLSIQDFNLGPVDIRKKLDLYYQSITHLNSSLVAKTVYFFLEISKIMTPYINVLFQIW